MRLLGKFSVHLCKKGFVPRRVYHGGTGTGISFVCFNSRSVFEIWYLFFYFFIYLFYLEGYFLFN